MNNKLVSSEKPFIHLFTTINKYYLYDVNANRIVNIPLDVYKYLSDLEIEVSDKIIHYIKHLKENGFLKCNRVEKVCHPMNEVLPYLLKNKMTQMILQVTQNCNLRCEYCIYSGGYYNRTHNNSRMEWDTVAKPAIDFFINHSKDRKLIYLSFYGGEPLLEYDLIKKCVYYAEEKASGKEIRFGLTTNGTLLTVDKMDFLVNHNFRILFSLDGPKEIHDKNRIFAGKKQGSYDVLIKNVSILKERHPDFFSKHVGFNTVMDSTNSFDYINEFVMNFKLFDGMTFSATVVTDDYAKEKTEYSDVYLEEYRYEFFVFLLYKIGRVSEKNVSKLIINSVKYMHLWEGLERQNIYSELPECYHRGGPCVPGVKRIFVNTEGNLYPCERVSELSCETCIGSVPSGINIDQVEKILNIENLTKEKCRNCWAYRFCTICITKADTGNALSGTLIEKHCDEVKSILENDFKDYCVLRELGYKTLQ